MYTISFHPPAPGTRGYSTGIPADVGYQNSVWSPSINDWRAISLRFVMNALQPVYGSDARGFGFQLRCLSE